MNIVTQSLFENRMQSILTDIVCIALENRPYLIKNQVETSLNDFNMNDQIICESESKIDSFGRIGFNLNLKSIEGLYIAKTEIYFDKNGAYNEASFNLIDPEYVDTNLIEKLNFNKRQIAKNIFQGRQKSTKFETLKLINLENQLHSLFLEILTIALNERPTLIENKYHKDEFNINQDLIIESEIKIDSYNQPDFYIKLKSKNKKCIVEFELNIYDNFTESEHGFRFKIENYVDSNLINILQLHKLDIAKNIFKYPKV